MSDIQNSACKPGNKLLSNDDFYLLPEKCQIHYEVTYTADKSRAEPTFELKRQNIAERFSCICSTGGAGAMDLKYSPVSNNYFCSYLSSPQDAAQNITWSDIDGNGTFSIADKFFIDSQEIPEEERPYFAIAFQESFELILQAEIDAQAS